MHDEVRPPITLTLERYMNLLGWNQGDLANAARVSQAQVSGWFSRDRPRPISRSHINRIAWAIADAVRKGPIRGSTTAEEDLSVMDRLDDVLNQLLTEAGHRAFTGGGHDLVLSRLSSEDDRSRRVLRTGWVPYPCFCSRPPDAPKDADPVGIAVDTMKVVAHLMGVEISWQQCDWNNVLAALANRKIDVVCPTLMELPRRLFQVRFSDPLPGIDVGVDVLVHKLTKERVVRRISKDPAQEDVLVGFVEGEIGETLHRFVVPGVKDHRFSTFQKAVDALRRRPGEDPIDCIVADYMICRGLAEEYPNDLVVLDKKKKGDLKLTVAAAVNLDEQRLLTIINDCIKIMTNTGYFQNEIYTTACGRSLKDVGVLDLEAVNMKAKRITSRQK